jgi:YidC/Oxa1 family membrane protein insertase
VPPAAAAATPKPEPLLSAGVRADGGGAYRLFVGPKDYNLLKSMGQEVERVIDFSRFSLIYICTKGLFLALTWINASVGNYGWSIILLTILVRLVFFPIMYKSSITMRQTSKKMAKVQPRVKAIQDRYRKMKKSMETQRQMNDEVMALYKKEGINPMANLGGCLPLLLQMPVFIAFYNLLAVTIEMRHAPFGLWLQDLSRRDPYYITPLLMGGSWLAQQWMTSSSIPDPTQRRMMMFMPVMFTFFMMNMPSGLVIYWLTSNLLGMGQQYLTNRKADQLEAEAQHRDQSG